jgi:hypothetical protein
VLPANHLQLNARLVSYEYGSFMVPLMALANHQVNNNCPHADYLDYCPGSSAAKQAAAGKEDEADAEAAIDDLCIFWAAGADVMPGQEVCTSYGYLLPDVALLQYGLLLQDSNATTAAAAGADAGGAERLELNAMDRHDFNPKQPFAPLQSGHEAPEPFSGEIPTPEQVENGSIAHSNTCRLFTPRIPDAVPGCPNFLLLFTGRPVAAVTCAFMNNVCGSLLLLLLLLLEHCLQEPLNRPWQKCPASSCATPTSRQSKHIKQHQPSAPPRMTGVASCSHRCAFGVNVALRRLKRKSNG